jgi:hypothetical protein
VYRGSQLYSNSKYVPQKREIVQSVGRLAMGWTTKRSEFGVPKGARIFTSPCRPDRLRSIQPPIQWVPGLFPGGKAAGAWSWPLTSS